MNEGTSKNSPFWDWISFLQYSVYISFVDCDGFGPLGQSSGGMKDSQITTSSSQIKTFLPYSAKLEGNLSGWIPLRASGGELHNVHFIQVDLRYVIQTKFVVSIANTLPVQIISFEGLVQSLCFWKLVTSE